LSVKLKDRQEFDGGDAQLLEIGNLLNQTGICTTRFFRNPGAGMSGEASYVHLINDGPRGRSAQQRVAFPIVRVWIHHHTLHRRGCVVAFQVRSHATVVLWNNYAAPVWVQKNLARIKPHSAWGIKRPLDPISIELPQLQARHKHVPVMVGAVGRWVDRNDAARQGITFPLKEQQFHA
jgi:hypothetical protein